MLVAPGTKSYGNITAVFTCLRNFSFEFSERHSKTRFGCQIPEVAGSSPSYTNFRIYLLHTIYLCNKIFKIHWIIYQCCCVFIGLYLCLYQCLCWNLENVTWTCDLSKSVPHYHQIKITWWISFQIHYRHRNTHKHHPIKHGRPWYIIQCILNILLQR